ncbi:MAG: hypothetical protein J7L07_10310 [Candidatus Odinarchaeota archaeon]|nr:hypothetical protein [Candidatus Odinarchaeota archaeon]
MVTIQVSGDTKIRLLKLATELQLKLSRKVSIDEVIRFLLRKRRNKDKLIRFFSCLKGRDIGKAYKLLQELRHDEEKRLEKFKGYLNALERYH